MATAYDDLDRFLDTDLPAAPAAPPLAAPRKAQAPDDLDRFLDMDLPPQRSALGEIGSQLAAGVVAEIPRQAGQALQYISEPGETLHETGKGWAEAAEKGGALPEYQPHPEEHGAIVNALAAGGRMLGPSVAAPLAVAGGLSLLPEAAISGTAALGLSALAGSVPAALQQGQQTLETLREQGVPEEDARAAARRSAAIEGAGETLGTYAGGKLLGVGRKAISGALGKGVTAGEAALTGATAPGLVKPFVKQLGETAATEVGTEIGQAAGQTAVERAYGGKGPSPLEAAGEVIGPTLGMTALLAPFGLAAFVHGNRQAQKRAAALASEKTDPAARAEAAAAIAREIHPHDPAAAAQFHQNVMADIQAGASIEIGPHLLGPRVPGVQGVQPAATPWETTPGAGPGAPPPAGPAAPVAPAWETSFGAPTPPLSPSQWQTFPGAMPPFPGADRMPPVPITPTPPLPVTPTPPLAREPIPPPARAGAAGRLDATTQVGQPIPAAVPQGPPSGPLTSSEVSGDTRGTLAATRGYDIQRGTPAETLPLREPQEGGRPEVLQGMPRELHEALAALPPPEQGTTQKGQLQELRRRVVQKGEDPKTALLEVWGPSIRNAPPSVHEALIRSLALPEVPSATARGKETETPPIQTGGTTREETETKAPSRIDATQAANALITAQEREKGAAYSPTARAAAEPTGAQTTLGGIRQTAEEAANVLVSRAEQGLDLIPQSKKTSTLERFPQAATADTKDPANFPEAKTLLTQGYSALQRPAQREVLSRVLSSLHDDQVFDSVVSSIPIDVVDNLLGKKLTPQELRHDRSVFKDALAAKGGTPVGASAIDAAVASLRDMQTKAAAKGPLASDETRGPIKETPASGTRQRDAALPPSIITEPKEEVIYAESQQKPAEDHGRGRPRSGLRGETGYPAARGEGVREEGQAGRHQEPARAEEAVGEKEEGPGPRPADLERAPGPPITPARGGALPPEAGGVPAVGPVVPSKQPLRKEPVEEVKKEGLKVEGGATGLKEPTILPAPAIRPEAQGAPTTATTPKGQPVNLRYTLVEADDLVASHNAEGKPNPEYPGYLQPRDRSRQASALQIQRIAGSLAPERLGASPTVSEGAPIVGPDLAIESGNGRVLAIRKASPERMQAYRAYLRENAEKFGLSSTQIDAMKTPVLVRVRATKMTDAERAAFARDANESTTARMSPAEEARADAARVGTALEDYLPDEAGNVLAMQNRGFVKRFIAGLAPEEASALTTAEGAPTKQLGDRIRAAVFHSAYRDERLLGLFAEEADPEIRNVIAGLNRAAPEFARARGLSENLGPYNVVPAIVEAAEVIRQARSANQAVSEAVAQQGLFGARDPNANAIALFMDHNKRSAKRLGEGLRAMAGFIEGELRKAGNLGLFAETPPTLGDLIARTNQYIEKRYGQENAIDQDLFAEPERDARVAIARPEGRKPGEGEPARAPAEGAEEAVAHAYGAANKVFTAEAHAAARELLRKKLGTLRTGLDPEMFQAGLTVAGFHIEAGAREFAAFTKAMVKDLGEGIRPYLRRLFNAVRENQGFDFGAPVVAQPRETTPVARTERQTYAIGDEVRPIPGKGPSIRKAGRVQNVRISNEGEQRITVEGQGGYFLASGYELAPADETEKPIGAENVRPDRGRRVEGEEPTGVPAPEGTAEAPAVPEKPGGAVPGGVQRPDVAGHEGDRGPAVPEKGPGDRHGAAPDTGESDRAARRAAQRAERAERAARELKGTNYRITPADAIGTGGWKTRARQNIAAIKIVRALAAEGRPASAEEQAQLVKYVGWGSSELANGMFENYGRFQEGWETLGRELAELLTDEEMAAARASTLNAHYTSPAVIGGIYQALEQFGFKGGRILEPGAGIGHFIGLRPDGLAEHTRYTAVELDSISAAIGRALYPREDVRSQDFAEFLMPKNFFDVAIGNPPFADIKISKDHEYARFRYPLHDFMIVKSLDRVRPGGLMALVTSRYSMDKAGAVARLAIQKQADLIGAIRLPQTAFKENAGTEVVTDILFFRKRLPSEEKAGEAWTKQVEVKTPEGPTSINEYYAAHPEMVLGTHRLVGSMYTDKEYTVLPRRGEDIKDSLRTAIARLPKDLYQETTTERPPEQALDADLNPDTPKENAYYLKGAMIFQRHNGVGVPQAKLSKRDQDLIKRFVPLRDAGLKVLAVQMDRESSEADLTAAQTALGRAYDLFVKDFGPIGKEIVTTWTDKKGVERERVKRPNFDPYNGDPDAHRVASFESAYDRKTGQVRKAAIFTERVINPVVAPKIEGPTDALHFTVADLGRVDIERIAELSHMTEAETIEALGDSIYEDPETRAWEPAADYLSGPVRQKLRYAETAAEADPAYRRNITALKAVQPADLPPSRIHVAFGAPFLRREDIRDFARELGLRVNVTHVPEFATWQVEGQGDAEYGIAGTSEWGTPRYNAVRLLDAALNKRTVKVMDPGSKGEAPTLNTEATEAANEKLARIKERFASWIFQDGERADHYVRSYNDTYNDSVKRDYGGPHIDYMTFPGLTSKIKPYLHQKRVAYRILQRGNTYMAHGVGAGKTIGSILAGMEMKRLGIKKKPAYVVPNHMLNQFATEFLQLYPAAKILVADEKNFGAAERNRFMGRIASENWDGIIVTHAAFKKIPLSARYQQDFINGFLDELRAMLAASDSRLKTKQIERAIERMEQRLAQILSQASTDRGVSFEETGIDQLFVDEAHEFRKIDFITNMSDIKGVDPNGSAKAFDLMNKQRYLDSLYPGRSLVLMSGTPITNTLGEAFSIQRLLQPETLKARGIDSFDSWASTFGDVVSELEPDPAGKYRVVTRFAEFVNVGQLSSMFGEVCDAVFTEDILGLKLPKIKGGHRQMVLSEPTELQMRYQDALDARLQAIKARRGRVKKGADIILTVIGDGQHAAIDQRFIDPSAPADPNSKLERLIEDVFAKWEEHKDRRLTQMIFNDIGLPEAEAKRGFSSYNYMRKELIRRGIPPREIAIMQDYKKIDDKQKLFEAMNRGDVRILIGSSQAMGTGVNAQRLLKAVHQLDPDRYLPANITQREGRIVRQGNLHAEWGEEVEVIAYAAKVPADEAMWGTMERKQRFIDDFLKGQVATDTAEDIDSGADLFALARALSSRDPRVMQLASLEGDLQRLTRLESSHADDQVRLRRIIHGNKQGIAATERANTELRETIEAITDTRGDKFRADAFGKTYTERKAAGEALLAHAREAVKKAKKEGLPRVANVGHLAGLPIRFAVTKYGKDFYAQIGLAGKGSQEMWLKPLNEVELNEPAFLKDPVQLMAALEGHSRAFDVRLHANERSIRDLKQEMADAEQRIGLPFEKAAELAETRTKVTELKQALDADTRQAPPEEAEEGGGARYSRGKPAKEFYRGKIEKAENLSPEEREIEARFAAKILDDMEGAIAWYRKTWDNVINTDNARDYSDDYFKNRPSTPQEEFTEAQKEARSKYAVAVHEPASWLVKQVWNRMLAEPVPANKLNMVLFTGGGTGAGKTTGIEAVPSLQKISKDVHIVYDSNMNDFEKAKMRVKQATDAGKNIQIFYVYRDPIESLEEGALTRATRQGRTVPLEEHANTHIGARKVIAELAEHYAGDPRVGIHGVDNSRGRYNAVEAPLAGLPEVKYTQRELEEKLYETAREARSAGRIPERVYAGTVRSYERGRSDRLPQKPSEQGGRRSHGPVVREGAERRGPQGPPRLGTPAASPRRDTSGRDTSALEGHPDQRLIDAKFPANFIHGQAAVSERDRPVQFPSNAEQGLLYYAASRKPAVTEDMPYGRPMDAKQVADLRKRMASLPHGHSLIYIPTRGGMKTLMVRNGHEAKVAGVIVQPIAVDVVYVLGREQGSPEYLFHDVPVDELLSDAKALALARRASNDVSSPLLPNEVAALRHGDFSHRTTPSVTHTSGSLKIELREAFGEKAVRRLLQSALKIVDRDDQLPPNLQHREGGVRGVHDKGVSYLVAGNIAKGHGKSVALHEIGVHHGLEGVLGKKLHGEVMGQFKAILAPLEKAIADEKSQAELAKIRERIAAQSPLAAALVEARGQVRNDTAARYLTEESLAYLVEDRANRDLPLVRRILAAVRAFLLRMGVPLRNITPDDLVALARAAVRRVSRGETTQFAAAGKMVPAYAASAMRGLPLFSRKADQQRLKSVRDAIAELAAGKAEGVARGLRPDLSQYGGDADVHFPWGDQKRGVSHIGGQRGVEVLGRVLRAVALGAKVQYAPAKKTVRITHEGTVAILSLDEHGKRKTWLLTGWEGKSDARKEVGTRTAAMQPGPTFSRTDLGADFLDTIATASGPVKGPRYSRGRPPGPSLGQVLQSKNTQRVRDWFAPRLDRARVLLQDRLLMLRRHQEAVEARHGPISEESDAYLASTLYHGRAEDRMTGLKDKHIDPLIEAIHASGASITQVDDFLYALHAEERNLLMASRNPRFDPESDQYGGVPGSGMTYDEAEIIAQAARDAGLYDSLMSISRQVQAMNEATLNSRVADGLMSQEQADEWRSMWKYYVPLRGVEGRHELPRIGHGFNIQGAESKRAFGRRSKAGDLLAHVVSQAEEAIIRGEKNRVGQAFLKFVEANKGPWRVKNVQFKPTLDPETGEMRFERDPFYTLAENVLTVKRAGQQVHIQLEDEALARSLKNLGAEDSNAIVRTLGTMTRALSFLSTSANPEFLISNFARDLQEAGINLSGEHGTKLTKKVMRNVPKALRGAYRAVRKGDTTDPWARHFRSLSAAGGLVGHLDTLSIEKQAGRLEGILKDLDPSKPRKVWIALRGVGRLIQDSNTVVESGVRLAAFVAAREAGMSVDKAAALAKNLTVNFNRRGELGSVMNSLYMFFNAGIQGTTRMIQALGHPRTQKIVGGIVGLGVLMEILNQATSGSGDDDKKYYDQIPAWVKDHNLILMMPDGEHYAMLPLPYGYNTFHALGRNVGSMFFGASPIDAAGAIVHAGLDAFNPLGGATSVLQFLSPTLTDPLVQQAENLSHFGTPIKPQSSPFGPPKPESSLYWNSVNPIARDVAAWLNDATGGSPVRPGAIDISPEILEHWTEFMAGGVGRTFMKTVNTATRLATGEDLPVKEIPFLRRVFGEPDERSAAGVYREHLNEVIRAREEIRYFRKAGDPGRAREVAREHAAELRLYPFAHGIDQQISTLTGRLRTLEARGAPRSVRDPIVERIEKLKAGFVKKFEQAAA